MMASKLSITLLVATAFAPWSCGSQSPPSDTAPGLSTAPYVLDLGENSATLCWVSGSPAPSSVDLTGPHGLRKFGDAAQRRYHRVELTGLEPGTSYRYSVAGIHEAVITTPTDDEYFRFAAFAHVAGTQSAREYPVEVLSNTLDDFGVDFGLCCGDITYYTSVDGMARAFLRTFRDFLATRPIHVAPGNHDGGFPQQLGCDYTALRTLFPYDYGNADEGAYHTFTRAHVRFIGLSYTADRKGGFVRQLEWLESVLAENKSEFVVVFFGGANPPLSGYDEPALFELMARYEVDAVFCHDGSGVFQTTTAGIPRFHIGTSGVGVRQFHLIDATPYELRIRLADTTRKLNGQIWTIPTKRSKTMVKRIENGEQADLPHSARVVFKKVDVPRSEFDAVRIRAEWPYDRPGVLLLFWAPHTGADLSMIGDGSYYRCRIMRMPTVGSHEFLVHMPRLEPLTGEPYTVENFILRIDHPVDEEPAPIATLIREFALVRNEK